MREADEELADLAIEAEFDRIQRYSDDSLAAQVKQNPDTDLDRIGFKVCNKRQAVKKDLMQLGAHSRVHVAEVFSNPGKTVCCTQTRSRSWNGENASPL